MMRCPLTFLTATLLTLAAAMLAQPTLGSAQSCGRNDCAGTQQISAVTVHHLEQIDETTVREVEPDSGETIEVTAYWDALLGAGGGCSCKLTASASVTVDVDWSDATDSWSATCTGCSGTGPIYGVMVCNVDSCGTIDNAWSYELVVNLDKNRGLCNGLWPGYLTRVEYETTSVDDGDAIRTANCTEWYSVSATSQTFSVTDYGAFECVNTCAAASGPALTITYE